MEPHRQLIDTIFAELKGRVKDDDSSVPQKNGDFRYWMAFDAGGEYAKWYRRPVAGGADAVILERAGTRARARLFPARRRCGQPGCAPARLRDRHQWLRALRAEGARSCDRHGPAGRDRELALRSRLGCGFEELPLYRRRRELALQDRLASSPRRCAIADRVVYREADPGIRCLARPHPVARASRSSTAATVRATKYVFCRPADFIGRSGAGLAARRRTAGTMSMSATIFSISASTTPM